MKELNILDLIEKQWQNFANEIMPLINRLGLTQLPLCDHAAIRVNSTANADNLCNELNQIADCISNKQINGRPILIFKLHQALTLGNWQIPCIELPYPSEKHYSVEGWEHIELVYPCKTVNAQQFTQLLSEKIPEIASILTNNSAPDLLIKISQPTGNDETLPNPTIAFKQGNICVKVHPHSIEDIISADKGV